MHSTLSQAGRVTHGNAAESNWLDACPAKEGSDTIVVGNPPFKGSKHQSKSQRDDMKTVFSGRVPNSGELDYVAIWFLKGADYSKATKSPFAFVSTNSIVQGASVSTLWPHLLDGLEIHFAHRSFKWSNLAAKNAGVTCVIVGLGAPTQDSKSLYDGETVRQVDLIGPYLAPNVTTIVAKRSRPIASDLGPMIFGCPPSVLTADSLPSLGICHERLACIHEFSDVQCMSTSYAFEKIGAAISGMASSALPLQKRLFHALIGLGPVQQRDFPEGEIREQFDRFWKTVTAVSDDVAGSFAATTDRMSEEEASSATEMLIGLHSSLGFYFEDRLKNA